MIGVVDEDDAPQALTIHYRGRKAIDKRGPAGKGAK
jgi:hypothetical protein